MIRIDLIDGNTASATYGDIVHQLFQRDFHKFQVSAKKIAGSGYFAHAPVRLKLQQFIDAWLDGHLLSDSFEHDRGISFYEAKVYDGDTLIYWGVIDTSVISYNYSDEVFEVTLYDRLRLLKLFEDLIMRHQWNVPIAPLSIISSFCTAIKNAIDIDIPLSNDLTIPALNLTNYLLTTIDYSEFAPLPPDTQFDEYNWYYDQFFNALTATAGYSVDPETGELFEDGDYHTSDFILIRPGQVYFSNVNLRYIAMYDSEQNVINPLSGTPQENQIAVKARDDAYYMRVTVYEDDVSSAIVKQHGSWSNPNCGYGDFYYPPRPVFVFAYLKTIRKEEYDGRVRYKGFYRGLKHVYYNRICPIITEYDNETEWVDSVEELDDHLSDFYLFFSTDHKKIHTLEAGFVDGSNVYDVVSGTDSKSARFNGNVIPDSMILKYNDALITEIEFMSVLKAMLLLYNATIIDEAGTLSLTNKDSFFGDPIVIDTTDIVKMTRKRVSADTIDFTLLNVLQGDTTVLGEILQQHYADLLSNQWAYSISIDDMTKHSSIDLFSKIQINGVTYGVVEIQPDHGKDEYKIVGWRL